MKLMLLTMLSNLLPIELCYPRPFLFSFEIESFSIALAVLGLYADQNGLELRDAPAFTQFLLPHSAGIKGICHYTQVDLSYF